MDIEIDFFHPEHLNDLAYDLGEQLKNTACAEIALKRISDGILPAAKPFTFLEEGRPVGFFLLDFGDDKAEITKNPNAVLLRSLSVNPSLQGRGIGTAAIAELTGFLKKHLPAADEIILAVNEDNPRAKSLYENSGFVLLPITRQGRRGLQFLMTKKI